jgi:hypothetical protein
MFLVVHAYLADLISVGWSWLDYYFILHMIAIVNVLKPLQLITNVGN